MTIRVILAVWLLVGYAGLTALRIPAFASDYALWWSAQPSQAPRASVNLAAAFILRGEYETATIWAARAVELAQRPESDYERAAVKTLIETQFDIIDAWTQVCTRNDYYQDLCSSR